MRYLVYWYLAHALLNGTKNPAWKDAVVEFPEKTPASETAKGFVRALGTKPVPSPIGAQTFQI